MRKSVRRNCLQLQSENDGNLTKSSNSISTSTLPAATTSSTMVLNASTPSSPPITRSKRNRLNIGTNEKLSDSSISSSNSLYSGSSINLGAKNQSTSTAATVATSAAAASSTLATTSPSKKDISNTLTPAITRSSKSVAASSSANTAQSSVSSSSPSPPITVKISPFSQLEAATSSSSSSTSKKVVASLDSEINLSSEVSNDIDIDSINEIFGSVESEKGQTDLNVVTENIAINSTHNEPATASNTEVSTCSATLPTTPSISPEIEKTIDSRKVEPIKINLNRDIVTRKVTYKQISKSSPEIVDEKKKSHKLPSSPSSSTSELYNSNDNDNTNGNIAARSAANAGSGQIFSEAHILPKLTIRGNCDIKHSVVPRLTIKMDSSNSPINSVFKETTAEICGNHDVADRNSLSSSPSPSPPPPPLPKLTIKTSGDIIESKITPAKHSPSSSSSCYVADSTHSPACLSPIPKLTIKTVPKLSASPVTTASYLTTSSTFEGDATTPGIPKLTIKTISTPVCSSSPSVSDRTSDDQNMVTTSTNSSESCIIPKLTIRAEPSEQNSNQVVPKLTIRTTKDSSPSTVNAGTGQTIPKFTIKTVQDNKVQPIPKLTISFNDYYCGNVVPSSQSTDSCVIRRTPKTIENTNSNSSSSSSTTVSSNEVEKIPKLTIRRRSTTDDENSDCSPQKKIVIVQESETANKIPKLTIKQVPAQNDEVEEERVPKITIKPLSEEAPDPKIPKITIKTIPPGDGDEERLPRLLIKQPSQDEAPCVNMINKVPKLTIRSVQNTDNSKTEFVPINSDEPPSEIIESIFEESDQQEQEEIKKSEEEVNEDEKLEHVVEKSENQQEEEPESDVILTSCPMDIDETCLGGTISNNQLDCVEGSSEGVPSIEITSQDDVDIEQVKLSVLSEVEEDTTICLTAPVATANETEISAREESIEQTSILQRVLECSSEEQLETAQQTVTDSLSSSSMSSLSQQPVDECNSIKNPPLDTNMTCNIINLCSENSVNDSNNENIINSDVVSNKNSSDGNQVSTSHSDSANRSHSVQEGGSIDCNEVIEIDDDDYEEAESGTIKEHKTMNMNVLESQIQQPSTQTDANPKIGAQSEYLNAFRKRIIEAALTRQLSAAKQQQQHQNLLELTTKNESSSILNNRVVYHNQMSPLSTIGDKSLKRISTIDSNGIFDEPPSKKMCPPLIDLTQSSNVMQINSNEDSNPQTVELLELSTVDSNTSTLDGHHQISSLSGGQCYPTTNEKLQNHFTDNSTSNIDMENNMNVDFRNMITCFKAQNVMMDNLQNNNKYIDGIEVKNLVPDSDSNTLIYIQEESNSDCIILNNYSSDSMMKVDNSEENSFLQFQGGSNKRMNGNEHNFSMSHTTPIKRPRGRPRKDGKPAGSVKKESSRKYQSTVNHSAEIPVYSPPSFTSIGQTPTTTTADISPNNSYATPRKYIRRGGIRGGVRGSGSIKKRGGVTRNRPRCIGGLLHTPDKTKDSPLFSPDRRKSIKLENKKSSPWEVFEEDTRMSADSVNNRPKPCEYLNNDDTQSSVLSSVSNTAEGNASQVKKRAKMEVTAPEGKTDYTVDMIAEYDWPPPKGCCPARNRDTFMIQEQIAQYLGIKSFKRKYPDLPRRQIDMEERNWLQEKGLVTEKMCDLGITAVWASDVLDIMCIDFYEKYEEYKNFLRQKQLRDSEAKQKAMAAEAVDKTLQARERALQSAAKWNSYFNKERKEDRRQCLDLQSLVINVPSTNSKTQEQPGVSQNFNPSSYPIALVPGQFVEHYTEYTPEELRCYPINTVLGNPDNIRRTFSSAPEYADAESDSKTCWSDDNDSSSSGWSSSSGSDSDSSSSSDDEEDTSDSELKCNVCLQNQNKNTLGYPEVFVRCYVCRKKTHPSCIEMPARMAARVRNYNWQCADCKYCSKCKLKRDEAKMLYCEQCDRGYHIYCIKIKNIPEGRWHCEHCAICVRCGTNKPEGNVPASTPPLNQKPSRWKKPKWIHEYRLDHITKLREHCSTLCIPCARQKNKGCR